MKKKLIALLLSGALCLTACKQNTEEPSLTDNGSSLSTVSANSKATAFEAPTASSSTQSITTASDNTAETGEASQTPSSIEEAPDTQQPNAIQTKNENADTPVKTEKTTVTSQKPSTPTTTTTTTTSKPAPAPSVSVSGHKKAIADISAMSLFKKMTIGWNLGNTLDATGNGLSSETAWGNPKAGQALINAVKQAGFDTIRIPVTWKGHFNESTYKIDEAWLKRVDEVINYALSNNMYVIINIHHDGNPDIYKNNTWLNPKPSDETKMLNQFKTMWQQIAAYFKDYDEYLIFAGMNELHEESWGNNIQPQWYSLTDKLNQAFVTTVRSTGGNNAKRSLIVQSYCATPEAALKMTIPTDTVSGRLMVEFHYYSPWNFAGKGMGDWGKNGTHKVDRYGQESDADWIFEQLRTKYINNNIPVVIGEYGAVNNKDGYDDYRRYYVEYITKSAKEHGLLPIWWDNGNDDGNNGEAFAIFNRHSGQKLHTDIHEAIMRGASGKSYTIKLP